uniref:IBB domain-containing protein n=1 Tax=Panagrolaimus superbus TaxID=310955 RepID=A0A914Y688_9BILA
MEAPESSNQYQDMYKNIGRTLATQRKRREEVCVTLRKQKREQFFSTKRAALEGAPSVGDVEDYISYTLYDDQVTEGLFSADEEKQEFSLMVYVARLEKEPEQARTEFWDMMSFGNLSALFDILKKSEMASNTQFLVLRIFALIAEDDDISLALATGIDLTKYLLWKFRNFDMKSIGDVLIILSLILKNTSVPTSSEQALFLIERCKRICQESPMPYIRGLAAHTIYKITEAIEDDILPVSIVSFAGDLIVSDELPLRISGYAIFNTLFSTYRMGNAVISSDRWHPVLDRCLTISGEEEEEAFQLLENLASFMLPYEISASPLCQQMWYIIDNDKYEGNEKRVKALSVLTELSIGSVDKMQLLMETNENARKVLALLLCRGKFDVRQQVLIILRNMLINLPSSIPLLVEKQTITGLSDLLTVMHPDTVILALEAIKAILEHGGTPMTSEGGESSFSFLAEEANVNSRLDFLVSSPNENVALLAMELLHEYIDQSDDDIVLPDDLIDLTLHPLS